MEPMKPKPFVLVLMPFSDDFDDVYRLGIKETCQDEGAHCERVDEQFFDGSILQRIYSQIDKADLIVSDMTGRNPNVFYETGYAHALGKRVILLTHTVDDIPFDLQHYPHIVYDGRISFLRDELAKRVRWALDHPAESLSRAEFTLGLSVLGVPLTEHPTVPCDVSLLRQEWIRDRPYVPLDVTFHNPGRGIVKGDAFRVGLVTTGYFRESEHTRSVSPLSEDAYLHHLPEVDTVFPGGWESLPCHLLTRTYGVHPSDGDTFPMTVRVFTELGPLDHPFSLVIGS